MSGILRTRQGARDRIARTRPERSFCWAYRLRLLSLTEYKAATEPDDMDYDGAVHELADGAVPVYTHDFWATFVDLAAYAEDTDEFGPFEDVGDSAKAAVYMIAERLAHTLLKEWWMDDDDQDDSETDD